MGLTRDFHYHVYGLAIAANGPIPGLVEGGASQEKLLDLRLHWNSRPAWAEETAPSQWSNPIVGVIDSSHLCPRGSRCWSIVCADGTRFWWDQNSGELWASWPETLSSEDTATYLLGPVLGFVLRQMGYVCLHASSIAIDGQAIALVGASGAGKSTTAAALAQRNCSILADDITVLQGSASFFTDASVPYVLPAYPRLRLWPTSVKALYGDPDCLPCLTPNWDKRYLDLTHALPRFQATSLPLRRIYWLAPRSADGAGPAIESLNARAALITLITHTYSNNCLDKQLRAQEFKFLSQLVNRVGVCQIRATADLQQLPELCDAILQDVRSSISSNLSNV